MSKFATRERFVALFEQALNNAGMQDSLDIGNKPVYWRGQVDDTSKDIFLLYIFTDSTELESADNEEVRRELYINGQLFTRSGYTDSGYQDLAIAIEEECKKVGLICNFGSESRDNSIDTESPIYYVNFEIKGKLRIL